MRAFMGRAGGMLAVVQSFLLSASLLLPAAAIAAVTTDKWDYSIGETVQISGDEMSPGEAVRVEVFFPDGSLAQEHVVTAGDDGTFSDTFVLAEGMPGGVYRVVATGLTSGAVFTTEFDPATSSCMNSEVPTISGATDSSLTISWLDDCSNEDGFRIHYGLSSGSLTSSVTVAATAGDNNQRSQLVSGLACGTTYYFQVEAFKNAPGPQSSSSTIVSGATSPCPPSDTTPPIITPNVSGTLGNAGWYVSDVTVSWSVADPESAVTATSDCDPVTITSDTPGTSLTCTATSAGGTASASVTIKRDATAPTITAVLSPSPDGTTGWYNIATGAPTVTYTCSDATSGIASCSDPYTFGEGADQSHTGTAVDEAGNSATATVSGVDVDLTAPTITYLGQSPAPNANGWNNTPVTLTWGCSDATSGPVAASVTATISTEGANQSATGTCTDVAGNSASDTQSGIDIDLTPPTDITWSNGPQDGATYYFGFVPGEPTCTATDALSGLAGCVVTGYGTSVGSHTMTATASDRADNVATATRTYTVLAWETYGFYRPVDPTPTVNTVKAGSTVPLKFEAFAGALELTDVAIVDSLTYRQVACNAFEDMTESPVELTATGGTALRYDWTAGQFIYNWKTPSTPSKCYKTTLLFDDGSEISAYFKLK